MSERIFILQSVSDSGRPIRDDLVDKLNQRGHLRNLDPAAGMELPVLKKKDGRFTVERIYEIVGIASPLYVPESGVNLNDFKHSIIFVRQKHHSYYEKYFNQKSST